MGDMADVFKGLKEHDKKRRTRNLSNASSEGWLMHTDYHWSRTLAGSRLDYWPSRNKWQYKGKIMCGNVTDYINKREAI